MNAFTVQKLTKEKLQLNSKEVEDPTKEQMHKLLDLVHSLKIAFDNTRWVVVQCEALN